MTVEKGRVEPILHEIKAVKGTSDPNTYVVSVDITDAFGDRYEADYVSNPNDTFGLAPTVRDGLDEWLDEGKPVDAYAPPSVDELRADMRPLTARQLRIQLIKSGFLPKTIEQVISNIPDSNAREIALVEWEYATEYKRDHPLIAQLASSLSLDDDTVDEMWTEALKR